MRPTFVPILIAGCLLGAGCTSSIEPEACYSPTANLDTAYEDDAVGCACNGEEDVCVEGVALVCEEGRWLAVEDGPCARPPTCDGTIVDSRSECLADDAYCIQLADGRFCTGPEAPACDGTIVDSRSDCLADDAYCIELPDGRFCTGPEAASCPLGSFAFPEDEACPEAYACWDQSESLRCISYRFTIDACEAMGGEAVSDPGDGSLYRDGCPGGAEAVGGIDADWDEGGLCCLTPTACSPRVAQMVGGCEPAPRYYWDGTSCEPRTGCHCVGPHCDAGFASESECLEAHAECEVDDVACGAWAGDTCGADEYCAYVPGEHCGAADAQSVCQPRPDFCTEEVDPVCGCDGETYTNACAANAAGTGVLSEGACEG